MSNATAMLAGVGLLSVCCISSSVVAGMMGGEKTIEETATTTPTGPSLPKGRYVRFTFHEGAPAKYILAPKEIKVFDKQGVNVALTKPWRLMDTIVSKGFLKKMPSMVKRILFGTPSMVVIRIG